MSEEKISKPVKPPTPIKPPKPVVKRKKLGRFRINVKKLDDNEIRKIRQNILKKVGLGD